MGMPMPCGQPELWHSHSAPIPLRDEEERLKRRGNIRPSSHIELQPDRVNNNVLATANETKRRRRMGNLFFRLFRKNRFDGCEASRIEAWQQHHAPQKILQQICALRFTKIFRPTVSSAKVVTFLWLTRLVLSEKC